MFVNGILVRVNEAAGQVGSLTTVGTTQSRELPGMLVEHD